MASQVLKSLVVTFDAVRVMSVTPQDAPSALHRKALHIDTDVEEYVALRLNQRPFLLFFMLKKEHKVCIRLCRDCERRVAIRGRVRNLRRHLNV